MNVAALVLAAETSSEFSGSKYLCELRGTTLIEAVLAEVRLWPVDDVIVVLGEDADPVLEAVDLTGCTVVVDLEPGGGEAAALRVGIDTLFRLDRHDTAVLIHADQLGSRPDDVARLLDQHRAGGKPAVLPKYRYALGHPVVVGDTIWPRLISVEGTIRFDQVLQAHPDWVDEVWFDRLPPRRITSPDDIADLLGLR
ncbi:MAG: NTP transferase domain-containing protein [Acidimicrobiia bacterium]|nr:NTP transferase domain-containing protein [Acidimicrobiia bacterium]